jgi:hypothetical protein
MDFRERIQKAAERGMQARESRQHAAAAKALSEEECRRLHLQHRLALTEHIEERLRDLVENFPGFRVETVVDADGWGAAVSRDDVGVAEGRRRNFYSRLQLVVSPFNKYHVLELVAKGTVRNKESFSRCHYQRLAEVDVESFRELVELWILDYAEQFASAD